MLLWLAGQHMKIRKCRVESLYGREMNLSYDHHTMVLRLWFIMSVRSKDLKSVVRGPWSVVRGPLSVCVN